MEKKLTALEQAILHAAAQNTVYTKRGSAPARAALTRKGLLNADGSITAQGEAALSAANAPLVAQRIVKGQQVQHVPRVTSRSAKRYCVCECTDAPPETWCVVITHSAKSSALYAALVRAGRTGKSYAVYDRLTQKFLPIDKT